MLVLIQAQTLNATTRPEGRALFNCGIRLPPKGLLTMILTLRNLVNSLFNGCEPQTLNPKPSALNPKPNPIIPQNSFGYSKCPLETGEGRRGEESVPREAALK